MDHPPAAANGDSVKGNKGSKVAKGGPCSKRVILNRVKSIFIKENCQLTGSRMPGTGPSLVAQWLRICLLMQGTRVRALVWEDPICRKATRPMGHNY